MFHIFLYDPHPTSTLLTSGEARRLSSEYEAHLAAFLLDEVSQAVGRAHTLQRASNAVDLLLQLLQCIHETARKHDRNKDCSWYDRDWIATYETPQERFLAGNPGLNSFIAQYALYFLGLSVVDFLSLNSDVAYEEFHETVPKDLLVSEGKESDGGVARILLLMPLFPFVGTSFARSSAPSPKLSTSCTRPSFHPKARKSLLSRVGCRPYSFLSARCNSSSNSSIVRCQCLPGRHRRLTIFPREQPLRCTCLLRRLASHHRLPRHATPPHRR